MNLPKKYRTLIVDDEKYARKDLRELLSEYTCIEVVGEAWNIQTAVEKIKQLSPDLIFLDIQYPGETGFEIFEKTPIHAKIIFVTAYDEYAIRAFEVNACDYLLKPVIPARLTLTINRLHEKQMAFKTQSNVFSNKDSIYLQLSNKYYFIRIDTIIKITAADHFTEITTAGGVKGLSNKHLSEWEGSLPADSFIQVHRSAIINLSYVEKIVRGKHYTLHVKLKNIETLIPISKKYLKQIKERYPFKN